MTNEELDTLKEPFADDVRWADHAAEDMRQSLTEFDTWLRTREEPAP
jgi:hypothetical protein